MSATSPAAEEPTGTPRRRGRPGYDADAVLRRAIEVFNRKGYDGTSMNDIAAALGMSKSAVFHHFPSKESLLAAALEESLAELTAVVSRAHADRETDAYERLRTVLHESVRVLIAHQPAVTLLLRVRGNSSLELDALARRRELDRQVADIVEEAIAAGELREDLDPFLVSRLLFGMVNSLVEWHRPDRASGEGADDPVDRIADTLVALSFDGLRRR